MLAAVCCGPLFAPGRAAATFPGRPGRIAWALAANDPNYHVSPDYGILTVQPSGRGERVLVSCATGDPNGDSPISCPQYSDVSYSADGTHLVWGLNTVAGQYELVVAAANGARRRVIAHPGEDEIEPSFSPRGDRLVYVRRRAGVRQIVTSDLAGGHVRLVTTGPVGHPEFSPDGRRILFIHRYSAWVVGTNGRGAKVLTTNAASADWSPNGKSILVVTPHGSLRTAPVAGNRWATLRIRLPDGSRGSNSSYAVFSPDGQSIAFDGPGPTIYTAPVGGGQARTIDYFNTGDEGPVGGSNGVVGLSWQPER